MGSASGSRALALAWLVPIALVLAHAVAFPLRMNCDCGMFLVAGRMVLEGKVPFVDIIDTNPPLIMYLSAVPAALERILPLHATTIFTLLVIAACAASTASLARLLRRPETGLSPAEADAAALLWASLSLAIDLERSFGQRDHLFMLAYFPYIVLRWIRWNGGGAGAGHAVALGLAAGTAACFRPFFVALLLAPEVYGLLFRRAPPRLLLRPETAAVVLAGVAYGAHFLLLPPHAREAIFLRWGPLIAANYDLWDDHLLALLRRRSSVFALGLAAAPFLLRAIARARRGGADPDPPARRLARFLAAVALACALHFVLARKGWPYRSHPSVGGATVVLALLLGPSLLRSSWPRVARVAILIAACASLSLLWKAPGVLGTYHEGRDSAMAAAIEAHSRPGDAVLVLSTNTRHAHPLTVQLDRRPATRFLTLFPLGFAYRGVTQPTDGRPFPYRAAGAQTPEESRFLSELLEDLARSRPALVFIPRSRSLPALPRGFDMEEYLSANGLLPRILLGTRYVGRFNGHDAYARAPESLPQRGH